MVYVVCVFVSAEVLWESLFIYEYVKTKAADTNKSEALVSSGQDDMWQWITLYSIFQIDISRWPWAPSLLSYHWGLHLWWSVHLMLGKWPCYSAYEPLRWKHWSTLGFIASQIKPSGVWCIQGSSSLYGNYLSMWWFLSDHFQWVKQSSEDIFFVLER